MAPGPSSSRSPFLLDLSNIEYYTGNLSPRTPASARSHLLTPRFPTSTSSDNGSLSSSDLPNSSSVSRMSRSHTGEISPTLKIFIKSVTSDRMHGSVGKLNKNPLWKSGRGKKSISAETLTLEILEGEEEGEFNNTLKKYLHAKMSECSTPIPDKTMMELEIRKYLRLMMENILFKQNDQKPITKESNLHVITKTLEVLVSNGALVVLVHKRLEMIYHCITKFQFESKKATKFSQSLENILTKLLNWRLMESIEDQPTYSSVKKYYAQIKKSNFLVEIVFKNEGTLTALTKYLDDLYKHQPKNLYPTLTSMLNRREQIQSSSSGFVDNPWEQYENHQYFLKKIHPCQILRTFIPSGIPLIDTITINYQQVTITLSGIEGLTPQEEYIFRLISEIYRRSQKRFDEQQLINEIKFLFNPASINWNEARKLWYQNEELPIDKKILLMKNVLFSDFIYWDSLKEMREPIDFEEFEKNYYSACTIPWLDLLRLTTFSCYGHAEIYSHSLYPEIYSIPFVHKKESLKLEINYENQNSYTVTQERRFSIYLRRQPSSSECTTEGGEPIAFLTFLWSVSPKQEPLTYVTSFLGTLSIKNIEFTNQVTLDEKETLHSTILRRNFSRFSEPCSSTG